MSLSEWCLLLALGFLWCWVFLLTKVALTDMQPFTVVALRLGIGAILMHAALLVSGTRMPPSPRLWAAFLGMGLLNNFIPFCLIAFGQREIASGLAAILNATTPLFTVLLAHVWTCDERLTPSRLAGVLLGIIGAIVMIGPGALRGLTASVVGELAILGAAISYACAGIFGRRLRHLPPVTAATGQVTMGALLVLPLALFVDTPWLRPMPGTTAWLAVGSAALFCTALGYWFYFRILATAGATNLLLVTLLLPVGALLLGATILGERIDARELTGMTLIAAGLASIDGRIFALLRPRLVVSG
jgi:drug/metabolite transporter (DMT)-like permease